MSGFVGSREDSIFSSLYDFYLVSLEFLEGSNKILRYLLVFLQLVSVYTNISVKYDPEIYDELK